MPPPLDHNPCPLFDHHFILTRALTHPQLFIISMTSQGIVVTNTKTETATINLEQELTMLRLSAWVSARHSTIHKHAYRTWKKGRRNRPCWWPNFQPPRKWSSWERSAQPASATWMARLQSGWYDKVAKVDRCPNHSLVLSWHYLDGGELHILSATVWSHERTLRASLRWWRRSWICRRWRGRWPSASRRTWERRWLRARTAPPPTWPRHPRRPEHSREHCR